MKDRNEDTNYDSYPPGMNEQDLEHVGENERNYKYPSERYLQERDSSKMRYYLDSGIYEIQVNNSNKELFVVATNFTTDFVYAGDIKECRKYCEDLAKKEKTTKTLRKLEKYGCSFKKETEMIKTINTNKSSICQTPKKRIKL